MNDFVEHELRSEDVPSSRGLLSLRWGGFSRPKPLVPEHRQETPPPPSQDSYEGVVVYTFDAERPWRAISKRFASKNFPRDYAEAWEYVSVMLPGEVVELDESFEEFLEASPGRYDLGEYGDVVVKDEPTQGSLLPPEESATSRFSGRSKPSSDDTRLRGDARAVSQEDRGNAAAKERRRRRAG